MDIFFSYRSNETHTTSLVQLFELSVQQMVDGWRSEPRVEPMFYGLLVALYASMIIVGAVGNLLVILVVVRNRAMRTPRNVYIVNLAISDLMLCLITMPLSLVEILYMTWQVLIYNKKIFCEILTQF